MNERYYPMSPHSKIILDVLTYRKYLEDIKEGKQVDREIKEQLLKNGNRGQHSVIAEHRYSIYTKRFVIHHYTNRAPISFQLHSK